MWHDTHVVGLPLNTPSPWHEAQATVTCAPVSGKVVAVLWLKVALCHVVAVWQVAQSVEYPVAACGGVVVLV